MPVYMHSSARFQGAESKSEDSMETCTHIVTSSAERCETDTCHDQGVCIPQSVSRTNAAPCAHGHRKCGLTDLHHAGTAIWHGPRRPRCAGHLVTCTQHRYTSRKIAGVVNSNGARHRLHSQQVLVL